MSKEFNSLNGYEVADATARAEIKSLKNSGNFKKILTSADDLDNIRENGFYYYMTDNRPNNAPFDSAGIVEVVAVDDRIIQRVTRYGDAGYCKMRVYFLSKWLKWCDYGLLVEDETNKGCYYRYVNGVQEWENPPMLNDVVYRTTKRCLGKPVYVQCGDIGNLPNSGTKTKGLAKSGDTIDRIIKLEVEAFRSGGQRYLFPIIKTSGISAFAYFDSSARTLTIRSTDDNSSYQGRYYVEYTLA